MEVQVHLPGGTSVDESGIAQDSGDNETGLRMSLRERPRKETRKVQKSCDRLNFLDDLGSSEREKRKTKRSTGGQKYAPYDEFGHLRHNGADVCDCMNPCCPGCWFECERCNSTKCGITCRVNRKFFYESMAFDGKDMTIMNPNIPPK